MVSRRIRSKRKTPNRASKKSRHRTNNRQRQRTRRGGGRGEGFLRRFGNTELVRDIMKTRKTLRRDQILSHFGTTAEELRIGEPWSEEVEANRIQVLTRIIESQHPESCKIVNPDAELNEIIGRRFLFHDHDTIISPKDDSCRDRTIRFFICELFALIEALPDPIPWITDYSLHRQIAFFELKIQIIAWLSYALNTVHIMDQILSHLGTTAEELGIAEPWSEEVVAKRIQVLTRIIESKHPESCKIVNPDAELNDIIGRRFVFHDGENRKHIYVNETTWRDKKLRSCILDLFWHIEVIAAPIPWITDTSLRRQMAFLESKIEEIAMFSYAVNSAHPEAYEAARRVCLVCEAARRGTRDDPPMTNEE